MPIGSLLLIAALIFLILFVLASPFLSEAELDVGESADRSALLAERERIFSAILEIESDHKMGKVPEMVFQEQRQAMMEKVAEVVAQLEKVPAGAASDEALEAMISQHKAK